MKCPHCRVEVHEGFVEEMLRQGSSIGEENGARHGEQAQPVQTFWSVKWMACPACNAAIIRLCKLWLPEYRSFITMTDAVVHPKSASRAKAPLEVPRDLATDFNEACLVVSDSPKASAALSRRCLQGVLRGQGFTQKDLAPAIEAALASRTLPSSLSRNLDAVRNIGNFAAHPMKDTNSGAIVPVEPHEAEWNLEVLEGLFDFFYVQPARDAARIAALNAKLQTAGKPPIK